MPRRCRPRDALSGPPRWFANRYRVAVVAEGDLIILATFVVLFREGHSCHPQHAYHHHRSNHAKNRHFTGHPNFTPLCGWALAVSLVGNIAGKGFLPAPWLTPVHSSVTTGVTSCICRMAILWKAPGESMAGNSRKLLRTSEPSMQRSRSYCPSTEPTLQPNILHVRSCQREERNDD